MKHSESSAQEILKESDIDNEQLLLHLREVAYHLAEEDGFQATSDHYWYQAEEMLGEELAT